MITFTINKIDKIIQTLRKVVIYGSSGMLIFLGILGLVIPLMPGISLIVVGLALYLRDEKNIKDINKSKILQFLKKKFDL